MRWPPRPTCRDRPGWKPAQRQPGHRASIALNGSVLVRPPGASIYVQARPAGQRWLGLGSSPPCAEQRPRLWKSAGPRCARAVTPGCAPDRVAIPLAACCPLCPCPLRATRSPASALRPIGQMTASAHYCQPPSDTRALTGEASRKVLFMMPHPAADEAMENW